jgi:hypothetical protein
MAVAVKRADAPTLSVVELDKVYSEEGAIFRNDASDIVRYKVVINAPEFDIVRDSFIFRLQANTDSQPRFFQLKPRRQGTHSIIVEAYQLDLEEELAAQTRVQITAKVQPQEVGQVALIEQFLTLLHKLRTDLQLAGLPDKVRRSVEIDLEIAEAEARDAEPSQLSSSPACKAWRFAGECHRAGGRGASASQAPADLAAASLSWLGRYFTNLDFPTADGINPLLKSEAARRSLLDSSAEIDPATAFALVRDMPYHRASDRRPETIIAEWQGTCSGKHYLLQALFAELGLPSQVMACTTFTPVEPARVPADIFPLYEAANRRFVDVHNYLVLKLDGDGSMIVDATCPFHPPLRSGQRALCTWADQQIAEPPLETWPVPPGGIPGVKEQLLRATSPRPSSAIAS